MYCVECFVGCFFGPRIIVAPIVDVSAAPTDRLASLAEPPKPNEVRGDPVQSVFQCELLSHVKYGFTVREMICEKAPSSCRERSGYNLLD